MSDDFDELNFDDDFEIDPEELMRANEREDEEEERRRAEDKQRRENEEVQLDDEYLGSLDDLYEVRKRRLCVLQPNRKDGSQVPPIPIANFRPQIISVQSRIEKRNNRQIVRVLCTHLETKDTKVIQLRSAKSLSSDRHFSEELRAQLPPEYRCFGRANEHLLQAAQQYQRNVVAVEVIECTGWWAEPASVLNPTTKHYYSLPSGGAIGADGINTQHTMSEELLFGNEAWPTNFNTLGAGMALPATDEDRDAAFVAFQRATELGDEGPNRATGIVVLYAFATTLRSRGMPIRTIVHIAGDTGHFKSTVSYLLTSFLRPVSHMHDQPMASWIDTAGSLMLKAHDYRDLPLVIDDFKGQPTAKSVVQAFGDGSSRGRLTVESAHRGTQLPRGGVISTGQDGLDEVESSNAARVITLRELVYHTRPGTASPRLTEFERGQQQAYRTFATMWFQWCAGQPDLEGLIRQAVLDFVPPSADTHARLKELSATFYAVGELLTQFITETWPERELWARGWVREMLAVLDTVVVEQQEQVESTAPAAVILDFIKQAISTGTGYMQHRLYDDVRIPAKLSAAPGSKPVALFDDDYVYLQERSIMAALKAGNREDLPFGWRQAREAFFSSGTGHYIGKARKNPRPTDRKGVGTSHGTITSGVAIPRNLIDGGASVQTSAPTGPIDEDPFL